MDRADILILIGTGVFLVIFVTWASYVVTFAIGYHRYMRSGQGARLYDVSSASDASITGGQDPWEDTKISEM